MNRYKVVQDGNGEWGILDRMLFTFDESRDAFAPFGFGLEGGMFRGIFRGAVELNTRRIPRDDFGWKTYTPRKGRLE